MKNLEIKETNQTPYVFCDMSGTIRLEGRSFPNNTVDFFNPIFDWVKDFKGDFAEIHIKLEYFNTSTCKQLLSILRLVASKLEDNFKVFWYYESDDEDALEIGQHYQTAIGGKFEYVVYCPKNEKRVWAMT